MRWRLWILLSAERGLLGREERYGWETIDEVKAYAATRMPSFNLEARCESTGERWRRVGGTWLQGEPLTARQKPAPARPMSEDERRRLYWMDTDGGGS